MKKPIIILLVIVFVFSFSACNFVENEDTTTQSTSKTTQAPNTTSPISDTTAGPGMYDGSLPLIDNLTTLTYLTHSGHAATSPKPSNDLLFYQYLEEKTNVHIEFEVVTRDVYTETVGARLAAGAALPDMVNLATISVNHADLEENGSIIDQTELFEKYAYWTNLLFDENPDTFGLFRSFMKNPNGKLYSILSCSVDYRYHTMGLLINKYWLEDLGLEMPDTTDDFTEVLRAFRDNDMNGDGVTSDEIPFVGTGSSISVIAHAYGLEYGTPFSGYRILEDGSVQYEAAQPQFKDYLAYMNMLYSEGLLTKEYPTMNGPLMQEYAANDKMGVAADWLQGGTAYSALNPRTNDRSGETPGFIPMIPLKGPYGDRVIVSRNQVSTDSIAISSTCKYPDLAIKWIDYQFASPEINKLAIYGIEGTHHTVENGKIVKAIPPEGKTFLYWMAQQGFFQQPRSQYKSVDYVKASMSDWWVDEVVKADPYYKIPTLSYGGWNLSSEQNERLKDLAVADMNTYANETIAKFISGEMSLDKYDEYVAKLYAMNLDEILKVYAESHAAMMSR